MQSTFIATMDMLRAVKKASSIKVNRNFDGFFADRLVQCLAEPSLLAVVERLSRAMDVQIEYIGGGQAAHFIASAQSEHAVSVLAWLRKHARVAAMLAMLRDEVAYADTLGSIVIDPVEVDDLGLYPEQPRYDVSIALQTLSPLAHGSDTKAGNATLFRRRQVMLPSGVIIDLPYYAGNALRGQMRDLLADDLLQQLDLPRDRSKPALALWFFHTLYAGGVLDESGAKLTAKIDAALGKNGAIRADGIRLFRNMLPGLSLLGAALGNRILSGRISVGDLRPCCREWGLGDIPHHQLTEHLFLTRRDDFEGRGDDDKHAGMIATTECLKEGVRLVGGIDIDTHATDLERSALGRGLQLFAERGCIGADNRRGLGKVEVSVADAPDPGLYLDDIAGRKTELLAYLEEIGALAKTTAESCEGPF